MRTVTLVYETHARTLFALLAGVCALGVFLYGGLLLGAVAHAAAATEAKREVAALSDKLASLESEYLSYNKVLTEARARELGFVAPVKVTVVKTATALSFNQLRELPQQ